MNHRLLASLCLFATSACVDNTNVSDSPNTAAQTPVIERGDEAEIYTYANSCVVVTLSDGESPILELRGDNESFSFSADSGSRFFMKASDLGTYLFYDQDRGYLVADDGPMVRQTTLDSDVYLVDDTYISGAEWQLEFSETVSFRYRLKSRKTGRYLGINGLVDAASDAAALELTTTDGCTPHPEMSLDASGTVEPKFYDDGSIFGFVDAHSHILANFGFGGGGIFHGAPFHRLGVEVAMGSCEHFHAEEGRADLLGSGFGDGEPLDEAALISLLGTGRLNQPSHATDGWPTFSDWPTRYSATHQSQYYKWLERAWMAGMRLVVQHAVSNEVFCDLMADPGFQPVRYGCRDMLNADRQLDEIRNMQRYIDAQNGGPGKGWFRVVDSPEQARDVIAEGKLAVVLGIELPNLFDCYLTPHSDSPECNEAYIEEHLDKYYAKGVRVLFPNHKYDNAFTPGDGHRGIVELGNFVTTGNYSNFVQDCPTDVEVTFDQGAVQFGGMNKPREQYLGPSAVEIIEFTASPLKDLLPYLPALREPPLEGDWCQKTGLTDAGRTLINGIMKRGMIPELDHLPRRSYAAVFEMLQEAEYPAAGTHGNTNFGKLYELGGISKAAFSRCADSANPGSIAQPFRDRRDAIEAAGGYPAEGFAFDFNGLATLNGPRFGPDSNCQQTQEDPVTYPFKSLDGNVTFTQPYFGDRKIDFNTEGVITIGMVPEFIEDARRTGVTDEDLDILFRSAEGYLRMWELAESKAQR